jgi:hypothetical protein
VLRVFGYWLLYTVVGVLVIAMVLGGGGDLGSEDERSPVAPRTKVIGACFGLALGAAILGWIVWRGRAGAPWWAIALVVAVGPVAFALGTWSWTRIARDLRARSKGRAA